MTGFDVAPTAVDGRPRAVPGVQVDYVVADLLKPPGEWTRRSTWSWRVMNIQAMPRDFRPAA